MLRRPVESAQYTSLAFGKTIRDAGILPSNGRRGDAFDNALAESFFATLETELIDRHTFKTRDQARLAVFEYLEGFYNPKRRHSALGYRSPAEYEQTQINSIKMNNNDRTAITV